jgi:hypothetical protein
MRVAVGKVPAEDQVIWRLLAIFVVKYLIILSRHSYPGSAISTKSKKSNVLDLRRVPGIDDLTDKALIGYLKVIAEINRNRTVLSYREEPRLTNNGADEFKVRMGFGLHAGWAIEGAVGSMQKVIIRHIDHIHHYISYHDYILSIIQVDATYLSPHVNMAARLETSSRQYGVPLLMSQNFYDLMSTEAQVCIYTHIPLQASITFLMLGLTRVLSLFRAIAAVSMLSRSRAQKFPSAFTRMTAYKIKLLRIKNLQCRQKTMRMKIMTKVCCYCYCFVFI